MLESTAQALVRAYAASCRTLAIAESCTGGMAAAAVVAVPGASDVFPGSVVSYANEVKIGVLGVREGTLRAHGAVSEACAREMARGVRQLMGADVAISTTGIAGPGGGTPEKPVGTVWFGISTAKGERAEKRQFDPKLSREEIRRAAAQHALELAMLGLDEA